MPWVWRWLWMREECSIANHISFPEAWQISMWRMGMWTRCSWFKHNLWVWLWKSHGNGLCKEDGCTNAQSPLSSGESAWSLHQAGILCWDHTAISHNKDLQQLRISQQQQASVSLSHVAAIILLPSCLCNFSVCCSSELLLKCIESGVSVFVPTVAHSKIHQQRMVLTQEALRQDWAHSGVAKISLL